MSNSSIKSQFGGALQVALDAVVEGGASSISVDYAGTKVEFLDSWTRTLTAHARQLRLKNQTLAAPVVLVYVDDSSEFASGKGWKRQPMLGIASTDNFAGILAVGTAGFGGCIHPQHLKDTAEFTAEIERAGLAEFLTISLVSTDKLIIWPEGILGGVRPNVRELDDAPFVLDLKKIERDLEIFYEEEARQTSKWWKDADSRITVETPEKVVQEALRVFLVGRYAEVAKVREEVVSGNGRTDITVRPSPAGGSHQSAVLELKTTRDVRTPKRTGKKPIKMPLATNIRWAKSGVQQVAAYRDHESFAGAFLCVYDFCASHGKEIDSAIQTAANLYQVIAKRYWITASHQEHRDERYPLGD